MYALRYIPKKEKEKCLLTSSQGGELQHKHAVKKAQKTYMEKGYQNKTGSGL